MQINGADARMLGSDSIDGPGQEIGGQNGRLDEGQTSFDEMLLEMESGDDSDLDLLLSGYSSEEADMAEEQEFMVEVKEHEREGAQELEQGRQAAMENVDRAEAMEDAEMMDFEELQLGMDAEGASDMMADMELEKNIDNDKVDGAGDRDGRSAGLIDAEEIDDDGPDLFKFQESEFLEEPNKESPRDKGVDSKNVTGETKLEIASAAEYQLDQAEEEQDRMDAAEEIEANDYEETQMYTEGEVERDPKMELEAEAQEQLSLEDDFQGSDRQGRSAGYIDIESLDNDGEEYLEVDAIEMSKAVNGNEATRNETGLSKEEIAVATEYQLDQAEEEQDRMDAAEEIEANDHEDTQMYTEGESVLLPDIVYDSSPEDTAAAKSGSAAAFELSDVSEESSSKDNTAIIDGPVGTDTALDDMLEEREQKLELDLEQSATEHKEWVDEVYDDIKEGEQIQLSVDDLFDGLSEESRTGGNQGPAESQQYAEQENADGNSSTSRNNLHQEGVGVSATPGEAILSTLAGANNFDKRSVKPEIYRMVNSIEATYYSQPGADALTVSDDGSSNKAAAADGDDSALGVHAKLDGVEIELKDDKYSNLGGTRIAFRRVDDVLEVNFTNDSPLAQEILAEQGALLLKELDNRFEGGIKITLNGEILGESEDSSEEKKVESSVEWDAPAIRNLGATAQWQQAGTTTDPQSTI